MILRHLATFFRVLLCIFATGLAATAVSLAPIEPVSMAKARLLAATFNFVVGGLTGMFGLRGTQYLIFAIGGAIALYQGREIFAAFKQAPRQPRAKRERVDRAASRAAALEVEALPARSARDRLSRVRDDALGVAATAPDQEGTIDLERDEDTIYEIALAGYRQLHGPGVTLPRNMFSEVRPFHATLSRKDRVATEYLMASHQFSADLSYEALRASHRVLNGPDAQLNFFHAIHAVNLIRDANRRLVAPEQRPRPIVLARRQRHRGDDWTARRSHLGGAPRLGSTPWPRGRKKGEPLHFIAQIDLAEIAAVCPESPLPHEGSLAFFVGDGGAVIHVPEGADAIASSPHDKMPSAKENDYPFPERRSPLTQDLFPFFALEPVILDLPDDLPAPNGDDEGSADIVSEAQQAALAAKFVKPRYSYSVYSARKEGVASADKLWWYGAQYIARQLHQALAERDLRIGFHEDILRKGEKFRAELAANQKLEPEDREKKIADSLASSDGSRDSIAKIVGEAEGLAQFNRHFDSFVAGRDPWTEMSEEEMTILKEAMQAAHSDYESLVRYFVPHGLDDLRDLCIRRMISGDDEAFAALPDDLLETVNAHRLPSGAIHQMFGVGTCIQDAIWDHLSDHLLLQIGYDDLPEMRFGDMGAYQFWISPENLAAGRWDKVEMTFECH